MSLDGCIWATGVLACLAGHLVIFQRMVVLEVGQSSFNQHPKIIKKSSLLSFPLSVYKILSERFHFLDRNLTRTNVPISYRTLIWLNQVSHLVASFQAFS